MILDQAGDFLRDGVEEGRQWPINEPSGLGVLVQGVLRHATSACELLGIGHSRARGTMTSKTGWSFAFIDGKIIIQSVPFAGERKAITSH